MCGIVAVAGRVGGRHRVWLGEACDSLRHRGPDSSGIWFSPDGKFGLGHRRLAVIDLSPLAHQPMVSDNGLLSITYNGEIYNYQELRDRLSRLGHRFRSASDTEVILAAYQQWGADCLAELIGMFAFVICDIRESTLFAARDRAGEKPLYYSVVGERIELASELKALLTGENRHPKVDAESLDYYLALGCVPCELSIVHGIHKLPPAHACTYDVRTSKLRVWRYWAPPQVTARASVTEAESSELANRLSVVLARAVERQLVADVPVGILLSGGVDSSVITALASRFVSKLRTYTVTFGSHSRLDEATHARLVADAFGTEHLTIDAGEISPDYLGELASHLDEPLADSSLIPTALVSRLVRAHCTVALGGDGGDELFGGYWRYSELASMQRRLRAVPRMARRAATGIASVMPVGMKGRGWLQRLEWNAQTGLPLAVPLFDASARRRLLGDQVPFQSAEERYERASTTVGDIVQRATRTDFSTYLPDDVLVKVDRASMISSLEVRAPLLDRDVVEFAFAEVPSVLKSTSQSRKVLLKKVARTLLPAQFDFERKQGFSIPLADWLRRGKWREFAADTLMSPAMPLDRGFINGVFTGHLAGRANSERVFALLMLELWWRLYRPTL